MPDEDEASREDPLWDRLDTRLPSEAFEPIARALEKGVDRNSLEALRGYLLPTFCSFYASCTTDKRFRIERERELRRRTEAAATLLASLRSRSFLDLPRALFDKASRGEFTGILEKLADPARIGPRERYRPNAAFRKELTPALIWAYEHITGQPARKPYPLRYGQGYGGDFYRFACAARACLRARFPELHACLLASEDALAQELKHHWPEDNMLTG
jgi:hypothetical protein